MSMERTTDQEGGRMSGQGQEQQEVRKPYQPKTGVPCSCRRGQQRDNCPACEGTGWQIDFRAIRQHTQQRGA